MWVVGSLLNQRGQVVIILLLVMVLALAVGLSVVGRSISEVSTASKTEQSARAFSAAEAGIEKLLQQDRAGTDTINTIPFTNQSQAQDIGWNAQLPKTNKALEYSPFGKESFAQFWLADPLSSPPGPVYNQSSLMVYFGDPHPNSDPTYYDSKPDDKPAVEVNIIYRNGANGYASVSSFFDSKSDRGNGFTGCSLSPAPIETNDSGGTNRSFYCSASVSGLPLNVASNIYPVMARVRILYTNISHPVALQPTGGASLPQQVSIFKSTGASGTVQRKLQVFQQKSVMPQLFDYALFSASSLSK